MQIGFPKVRKQQLLLIAGLVWLLAGVNILLIGAPAFMGSWNGNLLFAALSLGVCSLFIGLIFMPLVRKHNARILGLAQERVPVYLFFDGRSYLIMAFMMGGGIGLRNSGFASPIFIGVMYMGIGAALAGAGVLFLRRYTLSQNAAQLN